MENARAPEPAPDPDRAPAVGIGAALRRVVVGFRIVATAWLAVLAVLAVADGRARPVVAVAVVAAAATWTVLVARGDRGWLRAWPVLGADVLLAAALLVVGSGGTGPPWVGGWPFSSVVLVAALRGIGPGVATAAALATVSAAAAPGGVGTAALVSTALLYLLGAATVAWAAGVIRAHDARQRAVEAQLADERAARVRSQERADTAAHLHDSVLQVLALIQRRADDAPEVARLARSQERALRAWLDDPRHGTASAGLVQAVADVAADVERLHGVAVRLVSSGDLDAGEAADGVVDAVAGAVGEALTNAARHGGVTDVDVYVEVGQESVGVWVRDRGEGFDPAATDEGRGITHSIRARLDRVGGSADLRARAGWGVEWAFTAPTAAVPGPRTPSSLPHSGPERDVGAAGDDDGRLGRRGRS